MSSPGPTNLAEAHPEKVAGLQQAIQAMAREAAPPPILPEILGTTKHVLFGSVVLPAETQAVELEP
jgi:hypothetical protein